jgi:hypothetical protein
MRIHISIGRRVGGIIEGIIAAAIVAAMLTVAIACPGDAEAQMRPLLFTQPNATSSPRLVVAQSPSWTTDALLSNDSDALESVSFTDCLTQGASATLNPGDAFRLVNVGMWQCGNVRQFYTIPAQFNATTLLRFDDGKTKASFSVPPVGAIQPGGWLRISPVMNDADFMTSINVFPAGLVRLVIDVFDATNQKIGTEIFDTSAPVGQYALHTRFKVGSIVITTQSFGCVGCEAQPLYGFVITSDPSGGNARVLPF